jgi:membrane-bound lytic murein transglycosylase B
MRIFYLLPFLAVFVAFPVSAEAETLNKKPFGMWLNEFRQDAMKQGISKKTLDEAFSDIEPIESVIELDRKQPEGRMTLARYLKNTVTDHRVDEGKELMDEHRELLKKVSKEYGVQPEFVVALWGIETNFGSNTGGFDVVDSLATLAYDGRRSEFFRSELISALKILEQEHITVDEMQGSWAGALGQCQFMPSTFLKHAVDFNKNGKHDVWNEQGDVFASMANYLQSLGWNGDEGWGLRVQLPEGFDRSLLDIKKTKPMKEWSKLGVRKADGKPLPEKGMVKDMEVTVALVGEGEDAVPHLMYSNFKALLNWNRSRFFATAVGTLAERIGD